MPQAAILAISAIASYAQGQQQAANASKAANAQSKAAWDNYNIQKNQLEQESIQSSNIAMTEQSERAKQLLVEQARIRTMAGESGIFGNSVDALLQDSYMQSGIDVATIETNRLNRGINNNSQKGSVYAGAKDTNNRANASAQAAYDNAPSLVGTGLQIAGAYDKYQTQNKKG